MLEIVSILVVLGLISRSKKPKISSSVDFSRNAAEKPIIKNLIIPAGQPISSIFIPSQDAQFANSGERNRASVQGFAVFAPQHRSYEEGIAFDSRLLAKPFKGKAFVVNLVGTPIWSDWYIKSLSKNPNGYGCSVPPGALNVIFDAFPDAPKGGYCDFWGDIRRDITVPFIVNDIFGDEAESPLQATPENIERWKAARNEYLENKEAYDLEVLIDKNKAIVNELLESGFLSKYGDEIYIPFENGEKYVLDSNIFQFRGDLEQYLRNIKESGKKPANIKDGLLWYRN